MYVIVLPHLIAVIKVERLRVNVIADVFELPKPISIWENFLPSTKPRSLLPIPLEKDTLTEEGLHPHGNVLSIQSKSNIRPT